MKKSFLAPLLITIGCSVIFALLSSLNLFHKLDYRMYDAMIHLRKDPGVNENVTIIKADDISIEKLGEWPWSRDVLADVLIRLKELEARSAVFDIEYISPSKNGIAPSAEQNITRQIRETEKNVNEIVYDILVNGTDYYSINELWEMFYSANIQSFDDLIEYIKNNMSRDNDEYFAQAIQFFGYTWLTVNHQDLGYKTPEEDLDYVKSRLLLSKVNDEGNRIGPDNITTAEEAEEDIGFTPAMHKLLTRAKGVSFTNSVVDSDGVRRRMELLFKYDDRYLPQLALGPLLNIYETDEVVRERKAVIIKNAKDPETGYRKDIKIPTDLHGRIMINWRHGTNIDEQFKTESIYNIYHLDQMENDILSLINNILADEPVIGEDLFYLPYVYEIGDIAELYATAAMVKSQLMSQCQGFNIDGSEINGISEDEFESYYSLRAAFFDAVKAFIDKDYLPGILARIEVLKSENQWNAGDEVIDWIKEDFKGLALKYESYINFFNEEKELIKGSYCIIGNTATSTTDLGAMPFFKKYENVGIHANVMNTILTNNFIYTIEWYWGFIAATILFLFMLLFSSKSNTFQNIFNGVVVISFLIICIILFVVGGYYLPFIGSFLYMLINYIGLITLRFTISNKEKKFITQLASSFANKDTVEQLRKNPELFTTAGQKKIITALFTDIQKFSTFSESITKIYQEDGANQLIRHLNDYLGAMSDEILKNNGTIDKYEGDAIISMFGAPDTMNLHNGPEWAYYALASAIRMKQVEKHFNETHQDLFRRYTKEEFPHLKDDIILNPFKTRIGINTGEAYVGLMGSKTDTFSKLNYTMIGDTVNLAARLEGVNKAYASWILCSEDTWNMANSGENEGKIIARRLDQVRVVGRSTPVQLYNIIGFKNELSLAEREEIDIFHAGLDKYLQEDFVNAGKLFMQATATGVQDDTAMVFAQRCKDFIEKGVPEGWDGVINMTSK